MVEQEAKLLTTIERGGETLLMFDGSVCARAKGRWRKV
jgi:hypothetical protein